MRLRPIALAALLMTFAAASPLRAASENVRASNYDVTIDLGADGSADVSEKITLVVGAKSITWFERKVPGRRTDGIEFVAAFIDGRAAAPLANGRGVRIRQSGGFSAAQGLSARWEFEPTANGSRTFELRYRAPHVLARDLAGPHLLWTALPSDRTYPIDSARVRLRAPDGALAVDMSAKGGEMQPAASWTEGLLVTRAALNTRDTIVLDVTFSADTIRPAEPEWAVMAERAEHLAPAFVVAALTLLAIGAGALVMIHVRLRRAAPLDDVANRPAEEGDAAPAVASALLRRGQSSAWASLQAALFRLVRDGQLVIAKTSSGGSFSLAAFAVSLGTPGIVAPHEQWIVDSVRAEGGRVDLRALVRKLARRQREFRAELRREMIAHGLVDVDRAATSRGLALSGIVLVLLAFVVAMVLAAFLVDRLGSSLLTIAAAVFIDGLMFMIAGSAMAIVSVEGERAAARWRARAHEMRENIRMYGAGLTLRDFNRWLPFAIGAGLGGPWLKTFHSQLNANGAQTEDLAWMGMMGSPADAAAMVATFVAISSAASAGAGGASSAGAGGGSSSAG